MGFRITGLASDEFVSLYGLSDEELARRGVRRYIADQCPGFPDRIELRDARPGEALLLLNYVHQSGPTPYRASHAIFVREGALARYDRVGEVPEVLACRPISLRAFDAGHWMTDADLVPGTELARHIERLLADPAVSYLQAHFAKRGCYAARIVRA
jgi:hypothetical protein